MQQLTSSDSEDTEPFLTLPTFRMLALASPVLESFFERDLPASFHLAPPSPASSSSFHVPSSSDNSAASLLPVRRGLGSLFGLVSAPSAQPIKEARSRPRPSFAGRTLDGRPTDTDTLRQDAEAARLRTASSGSGSSSRPRTPVVEAPTPTLAAAAAFTREATTSQQLFSPVAPPAPSKRLSLRGTDMLISGVGSAKASLAAATAALLASPAEEHPLALSSDAGGFSEDQPATEEEEEEAEELQQRNRRSDSGSGSCRDKEDEDKALARALKRLSTALEVGTGTAEKSPPVQKIDLALLEHAEEL